MKSPYYTDPEVKKQIDEAKHQAVVLFQNLGKSSSKEERDAAKEEEIRIFESVLHLDPEYVSIMVVRDWCTTKR